MQDRPGLQASLQRVYRLNRAGSLLVRRLKKKAAGACACGFALGAFEPGVRDPKHEIRAAVSYSEFLSDGGSDL